MVWGGPVGAALLLAVEGGGGGGRISNIRPHPPPRSLRARGAAISWGEIRPHPPPLSLRARGPCFLSPQSSVLSPHVLSPQSLRDEEGEEGFLDVEAVFGL